MKSILKSILNKKNKQVNVSIPKNIRNKLLKIEKEKFLEIKVKIRGLKNSKKTNVDLTKLYPT